MEVIINLLKNNFHLINQIFQINLSIFLRYRIKRKIMQEIVRSHIHIYIYIYIYIYKSKLEFEGEYYHTSRDYKNPRCDITEGWRKSVVIFSIDASSPPSPYFLLFPLLRVSGPPYCKRGNNS